MMRALQIFEESDDGVCVSRVWGDLSDASMEAIGALLGPPDASTLTSSAVFASAVDVASSGTIVVTQGEL
jgi:hypothetical protein